MSGITDPSEEYFKDGLWGWVVNQWKKLTTDAAGHLQIDVVSSGLPAGGATAAHQTTMITALQLIDDLRNALNSIATDELDIVFDGQNVDVEVTQTTPADLRTGIHGWDGTVWRKLPLLWGYSDRWVETDTASASGAGNATASTGTVPEGSVFVLQSFATHHDAGAAKRVQVYATGTDGYTLLYDKLLSPSGEYQVIHGEWVLKKDDLVEAIAFAPGDGKTVVLRVWGYKMNVAA